MKKTLISAALSLIALSGCSNTSGLSANVGYSGFDNAKTVQIQPHGNDCSSMVCTGIGAQWNQSHPNSVILIINVFNDVTGITGAQLNIDGEIVTLNRTSGVTDFQIDNYVKNSTKGFVTDLSVVHRILNSKRTWLRVSTPTGYIEDRVIDGEQDSKAFHALKRFISSVDS